VKPTQRAEQGTERTKMFNSIFKIENRRSSPDYYGHFCLGVIMKILVITSGTDLFRL
jgi:hypothetical protein